MNRLVGAAGAGCLSGIVLFHRLDFYLFGGLGRGYSAAASPRAGLVQPADTRLETSDPRPTGTTSHAR